MENAYLKHLQYNISRITKKRLPQPHLYRKKGMRNEGTSHHTGYQVRRDRRNVSAYIKHTSANT